MRIVFKIYRVLISPAVHSFSKLMSGNPYSGCKFEPTCSCYSEQAIQKYGFWKGTLKSLLRISKCHPFSQAGGYDPL